MGMDCEVSNCGYNGANCRKVPIYEAFSKTERLVKEMKLPTKRRSGMSETADERERLG
jgi:hypothetical protein